MLLTVRDAILGTDSGDDGLTVRTRVEKLYIHVPSKSGKFKMFLNRTAGLLTDYRMPAGVTRLLKDCQIFSNFKGGRHFKKLGVLA